MVEKKEDGPKKRRLFGRRASQEVTAPSPEIVAAEVAPEEVPATEAPAAEAPEPTAEIAAQPETTEVENAEADTVIDAPAEEVVADKNPAVRNTTSLIFQAPDLPPLPEYVERQDRSERTDRREPQDAPAADGVRRRNRRRSGEESRPGDEAPNTVVRVREPRKAPEPITEPQRIKGSTRLEAKKQRRRDGRDAGRRRTVVTESEFLARRESVDRVMVVRSKHGRIQIAVLEDGVLVEHYVARSQEASLIGNVYLGRVQNVLPSMEAAFVDIGRGRNAVLYSGEVNWDAAALDSETGKNQARRIELALKSGDRVLVQVTKDPIGHKGARLTSQVSLPGRYLVYVPNGSMSGISRKLPDTERARLKKILKQVLPENVGVIVRTAAEGATEEQLTLDVSRLTNQWAEISRRVEKEQAPAMLHSEPDLLIKIIRDVFNEDFHRLVIEGDDARATITDYLRGVAPDLIDRVLAYDGDRDSFDEFRVSEQIEKALDRKVWLPSGGSLVIDRTEAMTVVDVNTGKFVGSGGNLEETVTKNNLEAAEEIVRQLRLRDIGGIIVVDFIDMVLESNRDLVSRRLVECLSRDRTKHQVAEVTSLGLVQMTRKKLGLGLLETFSEACDVCAGRGVIVHHDPVVKHRQTPQGDNGGNNSRRGRNNGNSNGNRGGSASASAPAVKNGVGSTGTHAITEDVRNALARVAASTVNGTGEGADEAAPVVSGIVPARGAAQDAPAADAAAPTEQAPAAETQAPSKKRSRRSSSRGQAQTAEAPAAEVAEAPANDATEASDALAEAPASEAAAPAVDAAPAQNEPEPAVAILDIPVTKQRTTRRISSQDAESILDSVLDALPEPKQPGQGRGRASRRASSPIITTSEGS